MKRQVVSMCVVPVIIKHTDSPKEVVIHAVLDSCSKETFVVEVLRIKGIETSVVVKTLYGESKIKSTLVDGLVLSNLLDQQSWITLPRYYMRKKLPVDPEEIPTPDN